MTGNTFSSILALETSTDACSVAVCHGASTATRRLVVPGAHASNIMRLIDEVLDESGAALNDIQGVAYGRGPGSFTGVRIAVALAQGLADGLSIPVLGLSSLQLLAQRVLTQDATSFTRVLVVQDARMAQLYAGWYGLSDDGVAVADREDCLVDVDGFDAMDAEFAVGGAFQRLPELTAAFRAQGIKIGESEGLPDASEALLIARTTPISGWREASEAAPVYLRDQVANPPSSG